MEKYYGQLTVDYDGHEGSVVFLIKEAGVPLDFLQAAALRNHLSEWLSKERAKQRRQDKWLTKL